MMKNPNSRQATAGAGVAALFALLMTGAAWGQTSPSFPVTLPLAVQVNNLPAGTTCSQSLNGSTIVLDCSSGGGSSSPTPTGCSATINNGSTASLASSGGLVSLAVSCPTPQSGSLSYTWSKNGTADATKTATAWSETLPANTSTTTSVTTSYQVQVCNGTACTMVPATPLTAVEAAATPVATPSACSGYANTINTTVDANNAGARTFPTFGPKDVLVIRINTGSQTTAQALPAGTFSEIAIAEYGSGTSGRIVNLSTTPCDFGTVSSRAPPVRVNYSYAVGPGTTSAVVLNTNSTYYLNVKNVSTCGTACGVLVTPRNILP